MPEMIRHRLYIKCSSVDEANAIRDALTVNGRFSFQNIIPHPTCADDDTAWNFLNWGTSFDCVQAVIRRPAKPDSFTLEFVTGGRMPVPIAEAISRQLGDRLVAWIAACSWENQIPDAAREIAEAGFPVRDLVQPLWRTYDVKAKRLA